MAAAIPVVWSDAHRRHVPSAEIWIGVRTPAVELPAWADAIRAELERAGHPVVEASPLPDDPGQAGSSRTSSPTPAWPVALIDIDAHHGNGAQTIFYDRADVVCGSVHVDPAA